MSTLSITLLSILAYFVGAIVTSFILGRIRFIDWNEYDREDLARSKYFELGIVAMYMFWPITMPIYMFFYTARYVHRFGNELWSKNETKALKQEIEDNKNQTIKSIRLIIDSKHEPSYRETPENRIVLTIDNVHRVNDSTFNIVSSECTFNINMSRKTLMQSNIQDLLNKLGVPNNSFHSKN